MKENQYGIVVLASHEEKDQLKLSDKDVYILKNKSERIGYGIISSTIEYLFIDKKFRGNGYGKSLFNSLLDKLAQKGIHEIEVVFPKNNVIVNRIVEKTNCMQIAMNNGVATYAIILNK